MWWHWASLQPVLLSLLISALVLQTWEGNATPSTSTAEVHNKAKELYTKRLITIKWMWPIIWCESWFWVKLPPLESSYTYSRYEVHVIIQERNWDGPVDRFMLLVTWSGDDCCPETLRDLSPSFVGTRRWLVVPLCYLLHRLAFMMRATSDTKRLRNNS